jgi:hypothetical protein
MNPPFVPLSRDGGGMDHPYIDGHDVESRYVMRRLSADEEQRFEAHLVECPECQGVVQSEIDLRDGLRDVSIADTPGVAARRGVWNRIALGRPVVLATAASILLVVSAALAMTLVRVSGRLDRATAAAADAGRRAEESARSANELLARLAQAERRSEAPPAPLGERGGAAAVFALNLARSPAGDSGAPDNRLRIGSAATWIVLSVDLAQQPESARFLTTLREAPSGLVVWSGGPFEMSSSETLSIALDAALLHPGDYVLELERPTSDGRPADAGRYRFRVTASRP